MGGEGPMKYVVEKLNETERVFGAENWTNYALEKLRETERDMGVGEWIKYVVDKLVEFLVVLENFGKIIIAVAFFLTLVLLCHGFLRILICFCRGFVRILICFCRGFVRILICFCRGFLCCGGTVVQKGVKMMIAPGTGRAFKIPRSSFEASPRSYFRGLRGK